MEDIRTDESTRVHGAAKATVLGILVLASLVTLALAAGAGGASQSTTSGAALLAQADAPPPIALETLTPRSAFTDAVSFDLTIGLQDGETITMSVTEPGNSLVAKITVQPGALFPWHTHPGPIAVNVAEGALVYIPANDCIERYYPAGTVFFDPGRGNVHTAYNAYDGVTVLIATYFEVPAEGPLTITEGIVPPENCDVEVGVHGH